MKQTSNAYVSFLSHQQTVLNYVRELLRSHFALFPSTELQPHSWACAQAPNAETYRRCWRESSVKWPLLPRSSLEQKPTDSRQHEAVEPRGGRRGQTEMRPCRGSNTETERFISSVTGVGRLVRRVRYGGGCDKMKSDHGGIRWGSKGRHHDQRGGTWPGASDHCY